LPHPAKQLFIAVVAVALTGSLAWGQSFPLDRIQKDLSVKKGRFISGPAEQPLINKGSEAGIRKGDLVTLYAPGQTVIDPDSGEKLGCLSEPIAICQVRKVHARFAEVSVKCPRDGCTVDLESGLEALRYRDVPAVFIDGSGKFFSDYKLLRARLGHFDWQGYKEGLFKSPKEDPSSPKVVFAARNDMLTVWGGGEILAVYPAEEKASTDGAVSAEREKGRAAGRWTGAAGNPPSAAAAIPGMVSEIPIKNPTVLASLDRVVRHFGVIEPIGGQTPFLIFLDENKITARAFNGEKTFHYQHEGFGELVHMSVGSHGRLALNIFVPGAGMRSRILECSDSSFQMVAGPLNYILAFMNAPDGDGPPQLWAQRFSPADLLIPAVYRMRLAGDTVSREKNLEVPYGYSIFGAFFADLNGNGIREHGFFNPGGKLVVYEAPENQWQSSASFSGALSPLLVNDPGYPDAAPRQVNVWRQPAVFKHRETVWAACVLNADSRSAMLRRSTGQRLLGILRPAGGSYRLSRLVDRFEGRVEDVVAYRDQLLVGVSEGGSSNNQGRSHILSFSIDDFMRP